MIDSQPHFAETAAGASTQVPRQRRQYSFAHALREVAAQISTESGIDIELEINPAAEENVAPGFADTLAVIEQATTSTVCCMHPAVLTLTVVLSAQILKIEATTATSASALIDPSSERKFHAALAETARTARALGGTVTVPADSACLWTATVRLPQPPQSPVQSSAQGEGRQS